MSCVIQDGAIAPSELLALQLVENLMREDLKPIEQAKAFRGLIGFNGWSVRQLARELAIDHSGVIRALALLDLPMSIQERVESGDMPAATAYEVSKITDPTEQAELATRIVSEGLSRAETVDVVRRAAGRKPKAKGRGRKLTSRVIRTAAGPRVTVEFARGLTPALVEAALVDALASLRAETEGKAAA